jgi:hypothetical protein
MAPNRSVRAHDIPAALWDSLAAAGGGHEMNDVGAGHEDVLPAEPNRCVEL